jgi:NADPH:quinone reductase-like Zn-dependent oxidoreductase
MQHSIVLMRTAMLQGQYQVKPKLPFIPGSEVSGTVCQLGQGVKGFKPGDLVSAAAGIIPLHAICRVQRVVSSIACFTGTVCQLGQGVKGFKPGDLVSTLHTGPVLASCAALHTLHYTALSLIALCMLTFH